MGKERNFFHLRTSRLASSPASDAAVGHSPSFTDTQVKDTSSLPSTAYFFMKVVRSEAMAYSSLQYIKGVVVSDELCPRP